MSFFIKKKINKQFKNRKSQIMQSSGDNNTLNNDNFCGIILDESSDDNNLNNKTSERIQSYYSCNLTNNKNNFKKKRFDER